MLALLGLVLSIGIGDSLNPSTVGPALYLATGPDAERSLLGFALGAFVAYTLGGLVLLFGPGHAILSALHPPTAHTKHVAELAAGGALLVAALALWAVRDRVRRRIGRAKPPAARSSLVVGALIVLFELPTAFPLFAAVAVIVASGRDAAIEAAFVVVFGLAFVAPLLAIAAIRWLAGSRGEAWLRAVRERLDRTTAVVLPAVVLGIALVLLALGASGLA